jgi:hypothetical protein
MVQAEITAERHDRILAELSELGLSLARELHAAALVAVADGAQEQAQTLSLAFHRISRSVRQTVALEAKLGRDRRRQDQDDRRADERRGEVQASRRKAQVRIAVERAIWTEAEGDEAERLADDLDDMLEAMALAEGFLEGPVEMLIARIRDDLGLAAAQIQSSPPISAAGPVPAVAGVSSA